MRLTVQGCRFEFNVADNGGGAHFDPFDVQFEVCFVVAEAHGSGFLGLRDPIDASERKALYDVAEKLGERAQQWVRAKFGEL